MSLSTAVGELFGVLGRNTANRGDVLVANTIAPHVGKAQVTRLLAHVLPPQDVDAMVGWQMTRSGKQALAPLSDVRAATLRLTGGDPLGGLLGHVYMPLNEAAASTGRSPGDLRVLADADAIPAVFDKSGRLYVSPQLPTAAAPVPQAAVPDSLGALPVVNTPAPLAPQVGAAASDIAPPLVPPAAPVRPVAAATTETQPAIVEHAVPAAEVADAAADEAARHTVKTKGWHAGVGALIVAGGVAALLRTNDDEPDAPEAPSPDTVSGGGPATTEPPAPAAEEAPADQTDAATDTTPAAPAEEVDAPATADPVRAQIVEIAQAEVGVSDADVARVEEYRSATAGIDPTAATRWEGYFAQWVMKQAGVPMGPDGAGGEQIQDVYEWAMRNDRFRPTQYTPQAGDLLLMKSPDTSHGRNVDNIGVIVKVHDDRTVDIIAGNVMRGSTSIGSVELLTKLPLEGEHARGFIVPPTGDGS